MGLYARSPSALEIRGRKVARLMRRLRVAAPWLEPSDYDLPAALAESVVAEYESRQKPTDAEIVETVTTTTKDEEEKEDDG